MSEAIEQVYQPNQAENSAPIDYLDPEIARIFTPEAWQRGTDEQIPADRSAAVNLSNPETREVLGQIRTLAGKVAGERQNLFIHNAGLVEIDGDAIVPVSTASQMRNWLLENVPCYKVEPVKDGKARKIHGQAVRSEDAATLVSRASAWRPHLTELKSVNSVPFLMADKFIPTVVTARGFYPSSGLYNVTETRVPEFLGPYSPEIATASLAWIRREIFSDFPFASPADEANAIAVPLMLLTRYLHGDVLPLVGVTAPEAGTGKSYLNQVFREILSPRDYGTTALPDDEREIEKVVASVLRTAQPVIHWDNVKRGSKVSSRTLCQLHTASTYTGRILQQTKMFTATNDRLWLLDGNGVGPSDDMVRRWLPIRLDADTQNPSFSGRQFRHPDLLHFIRDNRDEVLYHYLNLALCWFSGRPEPKHAQQSSSYQNLIHVVSGILEHGGEIHFWANLEESRRDAVDGSEQEIGYEFLRWLHKALPDSSQFTAADVVSKIHVLDGESKFMVTTTPLPEEIHRKWDGSVSAKSGAVTRYLQGIRGQRFTVGLETYRVNLIPVRSQNKTHFSIVLDVQGDAPDHDKQLTQEADLTRP